MLTHSVENRFISIIFAVLVLIVAPLFVLFFQLSEEKSTRDAVERSQIMIEANAKALGKPLWDYDVESIGQITKAMAAARFVVRIDVRDLTGQISVSMPENADVAGRNVVHLTAPV